MNGDWLHSRAITHRERTLRTQPTDSTRDYPRIGKNGKSLTYFGLILGPIASTAAFAFNDLIRSLLPVFSNLFILSVVNIPFDTTF